MKRGRSGKKKIVIILVIIIALLVAAATAFFFIRGRMFAQAAVPTVKSQSAEVTKGDLSTTVVGTGTLAAEAAKEMQIPVGITIDEVYVEEGDEVKKGDVLATIDKASLLESMDTVVDTIDELEDEIDEYDTDTYEYAIAVAKKENYEEKYEELLALEETYEIVSEYSGTIESVSITAGSTVSASQTSTGSSSQSSTSTTGAAVGMSYGSGSMTAAGMDNFVAVSAVTIGEIQEDETVTASQVASEDPETTASVDTLTAITACSPSIAAPVIGATPQQTIADMTEYTGVITWDTSDVVFQEGTSYVATVVLTAQSGYYFRENIQVRYVDASVTALAVDPEAEGNKITFVLTFPTLTQEASGTNANNNSGNSSTVEVDGQSNNSTTGEDGTNSGSGSGNDQQTTQGGDTQMDSSTSGQQSSSTTTQSSGSSASSDASDSDTSSGSIDNVNKEMATAFTIAGNDNMILSVSVDELDILSIAEDQKAEITFDALEDETFEGTITSISDTATTSSGGVSKYAVEVTIPRTDDMRQGMNASATIVVEEKNDILLIPVSAIQERGDTSFVYTQQDTETGDLSGEVEVETGISDGTQVEIVSGLSEGQIVYYTRSESTDDSSSESGMPGMGGFSGGEMPDMSGGSGGGFSGGDRSGNMGGGNMGGGAPQ